MKVIIHNNHFKTDLAFNSKTIETLVYESILSQYCRI